MSKLAFLSNIKAVGQEKPKATRNPANRNPEGMTIRLYHTGAIYPSLDLITAFDLNYRKRPTDEEVAKAKETKQPIFIGNGFDVFFGPDFAGLDMGGVEAIMISPAPRHEGKIDLFGSTGFNKETGEPLAEVANQGTTTFGEEVLIPLLEKLHSIKLDKDTRPYIDLELLGSDGTPDTPWKLPPNKNVAFIPKKVRKGKDLGSVTVQRRNDPSLYVLYPVSVEEETIAEAPENVSKPSDLVQA